MPGPTNDRCLLRKSNTRCTTDPARIARLKQVPNRPEKLDLSEHADLFHRGSAKPQASSQSRNTEGGRVSWALPAAVLNKPLPRIQPQRPNHPPYRRDDGSSSTRTGSSSTNHSRTYSEKPTSHGRPEEDSQPDSPSAPPSPDYEDAPHSDNSMVVRIGITRSPGHTPSPPMPDLVQSTSGSSSEYTDIEPPATAGGPWTGDGGTYHVDCQTIMSHDTDDKVRANNSATTTTTSTNSKRQAERGGIREGQTRCRVLNCAGVAYKDGVCMECLEGPELSMFGDSPRGSDTEAASPPPPPPSDIVEHAVQQMATGVKPAAVPTVVQGSTSSHNGSARRSPCDDLLEQVDRHMTITASLRQLPNGGLCRRARGGGEEDGKQDVERRAAPGGANGSDGYFDNRGVKTDYIKSARNSPTGCVFSGSAVRPVRLTSRFNSDSSLLVQPLRLRQKQQQRHRQEQQHQRPPVPHIYKSFLTSHQSPIGHTSSNSDSTNLLPQSRSQPASVAPSPTFLKSPSFAAQQRLRASGDSAAHLIAPNPTSTRRLRRTEPELLQARTYTVPLVARRVGSPGISPFSNTLSAASGYRTANHDRHQQQQKQRGRAPPHREYNPYESYFDFSSAEPSRNPSRVQSMELKNGSNGISSGLHYQHHETDPSAATVAEQICTRMESNGDKGEGSGSGGRRDIWLKSEGILPQLPPVYDIRSEEEYPGLCPGKYWF